MKHRILLSLLFFVSTLFPVADYYSPRSLALGMGGFSFTYDVNALYKNPALLGAFQFSVSGLSYQNRYGDHQKMETHLNGLLKSWNDRDRSDTARLSIDEHVRGLSNNGAAMYGFDAKVPAILVKNMGLGVARIKSAFISPEIRQGVLATDDDGAALFRTAGLDYTQYSLGYAFPLAEQFYLGAGAHLLSGKLDLRLRSLTDELFSASGESSDYIKKAVSDCQQKFTKIIFHMGILWKVAETLDVSLLMENIGNPSLYKAFYKDNGDEFDFELSQRYRASFAFRPRIDWGFYGDADIQKTPVYPGFDTLHQPVSLGIEKGFFQNSAFIRLGLNTDIARKHIIGEDSAMTFTFGIGLRISAMIIDAGLIMNGNGSINGLAIAGYYVVN